jgi:protein-disulfide isomerase
MKMTGETKFFIGIIIFTLAIIVGALVMFSKPPKEVSLETLVPESVWATGSATPKATLVEFSDFECPACASAHPIVKSVVEKYSSDLRFVYRHFPLEQHPNAQAAAEAAEAAGAQGKFWEMHDLLFQNQASLSPDIINGLAVELSLDMDKFASELNQGTYRDRVNKDKIDGQTLGIDSTPTFFLNGKKLQLFSFADLDSEVQKAINEGQ